MPDWSRLLEEHRAGRLPPDKARSLQIMIDHGQVPQEFVSPAPPQPSPRPAATPPPRINIEKASSPQPPARTATAIEPLEPFDLPRARASFERPVVPAALPPVEEPYPERQYRTPELAVLAKRYPQYEWAFRDFQPEIRHLVRRYGPTIFEYGAPVLAALLTRGRSLGAQATVAGLTAGGAQLAKETLLTTPDLRSPEAQGDYGPAVQRAVRTGAEVAGATYLGGKMPQTPAPVLGVPPAGMLTRGRNAALQAAGAGAGAGGGRLLVEPLAPSAEPVREAVDDAKTVAEFDLGFKAGAGLLRKTFGRSRLLTPEGAKAAETLAQRKMPIPAGVSESRLAGVTGAIGEEALLSGTRLGLRRTAGEAALSGEIGGEITAASQPRNPTVEQAMRAHGWQPGLSGEPRQANQATTIRRMYRALADANKQAVHATGQPLPMVGTQGLAGDVQGYATPGSPEHAALTALATSPTLMPQQAEVLHHHLTQWRPQAQLAAPMLDKLDNLLAALRKSIDDPTYIDMSHLRGTLRSLKQRAAGGIAPEVERLLTLVAEPPYRMSFGDAKELRSELMEIARSYEPGGAGRVPTPTGQAPRPGEGRRFARTVQRQAEQLARSVNTEMVRSMRQVDPALADAWQHSNIAYRVGIRADKLERWFYDPHLRDAQTGIFKGAAILHKIATHEAQGDLRALRDEFGATFVPNMRKVANALKYLQDTREPSQWRVGHHLMRYAVRGLQLGGGAYGAATGHYGEMMAFFMAPEVLGYVFQSPKLTNLFLRGIKAPAAAGVGWRALGQLSGILHSQGVLPTRDEQQGAPPAAETRSQAPASAPGAPPAGQPSRADRAQAFYREKLGTVPRAQADVFWQQMQRNPDDEARQGFLGAYVETYGQQPGVR